MKGIADYSFSEKLGTGNHGTFYKCRCPERLERDMEWVAVKVLESHADADEFRRFANELRLFMAVESDHLVELLDAGQQSGRLFYAMPFFPDGSLADGEHSEDESVLAVAGAARGAHALHEAGVAHRDIKPSNIMMSDEGARLSDLGLAQVLNPGQTVTGTGPIGSIEFMAPSVVRGEKASRASDIWQLGATLHKKLTGKSVFGEIPTGGVVAALRHILAAEPAIDSNLPDGVRSVLERALAPADEDRHPTAEELAADLEALA